MNKTFYLRNNRLLCNLRLPSGNQVIAQIVWAKRLFLNMYEVSVEYKSGDYDGGYHTWFTWISDGKFNFLVVAQYEDEVTKAIKDEVWQIEELERQADSDMRELQQASAPYLL